MPGATGREMKGWAFAKCGTNSWGVAASVTKGTRWMGDGGVKLQPAFIEDRSFGESFLGPSEAGDYSPTDATLGGQCRYEDYHYVLEALAMGSPATVAIATSAVGQTTSWTHVIDLAASIDGLCATFARDNKQYIEEITSAKIYGFGETVGDGGICEETFKVLGVAPTEISSVNINSTVYGATFPSLLGKIARNQGTFRINAQSGGALASTDAITTEMIEFSFERPQDRSYAYGSRNIIEPGDNEFPTPSLKVTFPRCNTVTCNSFRTAIRVGTAYKGDVTYLGTFINSTDTYKKLYQFPYLELQDFQAPAAGAAQVKPQLTFIVKQPASAPTGMSGVTKPFRLTHVMVNSTHAFA